jgi:hypothetical protein
MGSFNRHFGKDMRYILVPLVVVSLLVPSPTLLFAQEVPAGDEESSSTSSQDISTTETPQETGDLEFSPLPESPEGESEVSASGEEDEGEGEEPPQGLLDEDQNPDPDYGDDRAPRTKQPTVEPDQVDGSLRYVYPLTIPPGRLSDADLAAVDQRLRLALGLS